MVLFIADVLLCVCFRQSRNRYKSSAIALSVAQRYADLKLPVGIIVVDYKNQRIDGDFAPNPDCYPSLKALSDGIRGSVNATTMFSFWPVSHQVHSRTPHHGLNESLCI